MRKILISIVLLPMLILGQNTTFRLSPAYVMPTLVVTEQGIGPLSVLALGFTVGYDHKLSHEESLGFDFKPRVHIYDGDQDASELRFNVNYKKFRRNNAYFSSGLAVNYITSFVSQSPYGDGDDAKTITIGPSFLIGKRVFLSRIIFLDLGLGLSYNYPAFRYVEKTRTIDFDAEDLQYITYTETGGGFAYLSHVLTFQLGFIIN